MKELRDQPLHLLIGALIALAWGPIASATVYFIREQVQHKTVWGTVRPRLDMLGWGLGIVLEQGGEIWLRISEHYWASSLLFRWGI